MLKKSETGSMIKPSHHTYIRIVGFGSIAALLAAIPRETGLEMKHADDPAYVQAVKDSWADPNNLELQEEVLEEQAKIRGISYEPMSNPDASKHPEAAY